MAPQSPAQAGGKIESIQVLRGLAATLVAAFHLNGAGLVETGYHGLFSLFHHGEAGVDIFFVISGFIIYYVTRKRPGQTLRDFAEARFWRIMPPYWAILSLYILLGLALFFVMGDGSRLPTLRETIVSVFLLPHPDQIIIIAWTLAIEILFYLVFAVSYFRFGARGFFIAMIVWSLAAQVYKHQTAFEHPVLSLALYSGVAEFLFGAVIAHFFLKGGTRGHLPAFAIGCALFIAYMAGVFDGAPAIFGRETLAGIPAALIIFGALGFKGSVWRPLITWGESSYTLYLAHLLIFSIAGRTVAMAAGFNVYGSTLAMLIMLAIAVGASYAATVFLERPYQRWYRRRATAGAGGAKVNAT